MSCMQGATTLACPLQYVKEEQQSRRPKMCLPEGAGRFWATTVSLIACVSQGIRGAFRSLFRSKIDSAKLVILFFLNPPCTGVYGYLLQEATKIALKVGMQYIDAFNEIIFVCFSENDYCLYKSEYRKLNCEQ